MTGQKRRLGHILSKAVRPTTDPEAARAAKAALKAKRDAMRLLAKQKRFWAVHHVTTLPTNVQKQINASYKRARLAGETSLSYARWCAELYREPDDPSQYPGAIKLAAAGN